MTLMAMHKLIGGGGAAGVGATVTNGGSDGVVAGCGMLCCNCCCRHKQKKCCGDLVIKLAIAALVCIILCYVCFVVESKRSEMAVTEIIAEQQQQQPQPEQQSAHPQQQQQPQPKQHQNGYDDRNSLDDDGGGSGDGDLIIETHKRHDAGPALLLFHSNLNAMPAIEGNAIKRFSVPTATTTTATKSNGNNEVIEIISDGSEWLASEEMSLAKASATATAAHQLNDISKGVPPASDWMHRIPLQSADDNDEVAERRLFDVAPSPIEWITASMESGERYFPHELGFDGLPSDEHDVSVRLVDSGALGGGDDAIAGAVEGDGNYFNGDSVDDAAQPSVEEFLLSNAESGASNIVHATPVLKVAPVPLAPPPPPPSPPQPTPQLAIPSPAGIESILGTLFGNMANIIRPTDARSQKHQQYQQQQQLGGGRDANIWLRHFNC